MALVMLPCDLPWWSTVHKKLNLLLECTSLDAMLEHMQKIHDLCNVSLDPDDDDRTENVYAGLQTFTVAHMTAAERDHFTRNTIKSMARRAQSLKVHRPPRGLEFSLQQQTDSVEISYELMAALLANGFFATFPKRTDKTHPTLQDFNFTHYFRNLHQPTQQAKLRALLAYFDWLDADVANTVGALRFSRQVMTGKQWLTIDDWLECGMPLCPLDIRHDGRIERTRPEFVQTVFVSPRLGAGVLGAGRSQECLHLSIVPEVLPMLLHMEALEDNEAILVENARQMGRIIEQSPKQQRDAKWEPLSEPQTVSLLLMDAENYTDYPINQLEEDNILRELNKCLLAFRQKSACSIGEHRGKQNRIREQQNRFGMSPIVEGPGTPNGGKGAGAGDVSTTIVIRQASTSTKRSSYDSEKIRNDIAGRRAWLTPERSLGPSATTATLPADTQHQPHHQNNRDTRSVTTTAPGAGIMCGRRGRFIVLGSSGECLPVNRSLQLGQVNKKTLATHLTDSGGSMYSSCDSGSDEPDDVDDDDDAEFLSARGSFDNNNGESATDNGQVTDGNNKCHDYARRYAMELDSLENRFTFAEKLRVALSQSLSGGSDHYTASTDDDGDGSTGFVLREDSLDVDDCFSELERRSAEKHWLAEHNGDNAGGRLNGGDRTSSSSYSFSTDYSSELEEVYEQFSKWLDGDTTALDGAGTTVGAFKQLDTRDEAILSFANSLLKRTLSESFVGVSLQTDSACVSSSDSLSAEESNRQREFETRRQRLILSSRSLSLELQKQKHRIAAQLKHKSSLVRHKFGNGYSGARQNGAAKRSLRWSIAPVNSQQTVNCEDVTLKLQLSQAKSHRHAKPNVRAVATGNWGCGRRCNGDVQLKLIVQWMAASVAGLPCLMYYTAGHKKLSKLDTVCRVLLDRKWTVGELAAATLQNAQHILEAPGDVARRSECLFEKLIGLY